MFLSFFLPHGCLLPTFLSLGLSFPQRLPLPCAECALSQVKLVRTVLSLLGDSFPPDFPPPPHTLAESRIQACRTCDLRHASYLSYSSALFFLLPAWHFLGLADVSFLRTPSDITFYPFGEFPASCTLASYYHYVPVPRTDLDVTSTFPLSVGCLSSLPLRSDKMIL